MRDRFYLFACFFSWINFSDLVLDLQKNCKDATKRSHKPLTQFPVFNILYLNGTFVNNQGTNTDVTSNTDVADMESLLTRAHTLFILPNAPIMFQDLTLYLVIMSPQAPLGWDSFWDRLGFGDLNSFEENWSGIV